MLFPFDMELLITLKKASTEAVTSALSTPVFSAISLIMSALVTVLYFWSELESKIYGRANLNAAFRIKNEY